MRNARELDRDLYQFDQFAMDLPQGAEIDVSSFKLEADCSSLWIKRNDVFPLFLRTVRREMQNPEALRDKDLAERKLILTLIDTSQPMFDDSLDHAMPRAFCP